MGTRVLHIAEAAGGIERYLVTLLTKMKKYPEYEHILVCSDLFDLEKFRGLVTDTAVVSSMHNEISVSIDAKAALAVRKAIRRYHPDFVYCHSSKAGAIGRTADLGIPNRLIYNAHGWAFNRRDVGTRTIRLYEAVERILAPAADRIVCISEFEKESALEHGICRPDKLQVIPNGIDFDEYKWLRPKSRKELGIPEKAFVVGTVGRLTAQKAPDVFIRMAAAVKRQIPEAVFLMVGDGPQRAETEQWIKESGMQNGVIITGWVDDPMDYAACFDVALLLSRWEGFGLVLPEYMLMGKPIVASKADAIPSVVGDAGILVEVDDDRQAAEAVIRLYGDTALRDSLIEAGKERVKRFDAQRMADEHVKLFEQIQED